MKKSYFLNTSFGAVIIILGLMGIIPFQAHSAPGSLVLKNVTGINSYTEERKGNLAFIEIYDETAGQGVRISVLKNQYGVVPQEELLLYESCERSARVAMGSPGKYTLTVYFDSTTGGGSRKLRGGEGPDVAFTERNTLTGSTPETSQYYCVLERTAR